MTRATLTNSQRLNRAVRACEWCAYLRSIGATEEYIAKEHQHAALAPPPEPEKP